MSAVAGARSAAVFSGLSAWRRRLLLVACVLVVLFLPSSASAHEPFEITSEAVVRGGTLDLQVTLANSTAARLCPSPNAGTRLTAETLERSARQLERCAAEFYDVSVEGRVLPPREVRVKLTLEDDFAATLRYSLPVAGRLRFDATHLGRLDANHGAALTVTSEQRFLGQQLLTASTPSLEVTLDTPEGSSRVPPPAPRPSAFQYLKLGVEHILEGYDHLLFLAGLLLVVSSVRAALVTVTCFTLGHSLTLALATLAPLTLPSRWVEACIAGSIVFVGVDNIWRHGVRQRVARVRWWLPLLFGLVHGLGFASALRDVGFARSGESLWLALLCFNAGVELGQCGLTLLFLPALAALRRVGVLQEAGVKVLSVGVAAAGAFWLFERAFSG